MKKKFVIVQIYSDKRQYLHQLDNGDLTFLPNVFPEQLKYFDYRMDVENFLTEDPSMPKETNGVYGVEEIYIGTAQR